MKLVIGAIILVFFNASNCSSGKAAKEMGQEKEVKAVKNIKEVKFGSGGGFTGAVTQYLIKANGDVFMTDTETNQTTVKLKTLSETDINGIQQKLEKLPEEIWDFNHPYNMYSFVEAEGKRAAFGDPGYPVPKELGELYDYLQELINKKE